MKYDDHIEREGRPFLQLSLDLGGEQTTGFDVYDSVLQRYTRMSSNVDRPHSIDMDVESYLYHPAVADAEAAYEAAKDDHARSANVRERFKTGIDILRSYMDLRSTRKQMEQGELPGTQQVTHIRPEERGIPILGLDGDHDHEYVAVADRDSFKLYLVDTTAGVEVMQEDWRSAFIENAERFLADEYGDDAVELEPVF
ncbi:MAG: hypothetical protein SVU32_00490 [Candidatus Nanohaloarchaea archaeon]|nr:hypothetical protein [Candidatus Nanohaloarchaea archaeon]